MRAQRADILFKGQRTYNEWAEMTPWQRDDFIQRYTKYAEEQKKLMDEENAQLENKMKRQK